MEIYSQTSFIKIIKLLLFVDCVKNVNTGHDKPKLVPYSVAENRPLKRALGYNEDTYLNFTELTTKYRYRSEEHNVVTEDGYILTIFRIPSTCKSMNRYPVLLFHGIFDSSDLWIIQGPKRGLGYVLSDNCYDVWAANHRGNRYSRKHIRLDPDTDREYWNYSFDEHGNYDLPALIDYILAVSNRPKLFYIGHSQGTTNFFVMASLRPEYNKKIQLSIHLGPVAWLGYTSSPIPLILAPGTAIIKPLLEKTGYSEIFAKAQITHYLTEFLCQVDPDLSCGTILTLSTGYRKGTIYSKTLSTAFGHLLVGTSAKDIAHFGQLITSKNFQRYDEGLKGNLRRYGSIKPPQYDISRITSPVVLITAVNDWVSTVKDIKRLTNGLPNLVENYVVPKVYWSHHNHVWGIKAPKYVFPKILQYLKTFSNN